MVNFIRGLSSVPGAYTTFRGKRLKILRGKITEIESDSATRPGRIIKNKHKLLVNAAGGVVEITELQPEGKSRMGGDQFLRGYQPREDEILGDSSAGNVKKA